MTFTELLEEVYAITNRRDLVIETKSAIKSATLKAHNTDFRSKDLYEEGIQWPTAEFRQSLDYISIVSNFRALRFLKRVQDEYDETGVPFSIITTDEILDEYGQMKSDICYVAGRVIEIRSSVAFSKALFSCYVTPIVTEEGYSSWIALLQPYAIVFEAASQVLRMIGEAEKVQFYTQLRNEEYALLTINHTTDQGK